MARAQGSLEYLIIIAVVLAVSGIVVGYMTGIVGEHRSSATITGCKQAAVDCKASKLLSSTDPCLSCDTTCKDSSGVELFDGATYCCNHGQAETIFANSPGCYACGDANPCLGGLNCINHDCLTCTPATESLYCPAGTHCIDNQCLTCTPATESTYCSAPTPYCVNNKCVACKQDTNCASGYICSGGACVAGCRSDSGCALGYICSNEVCVAGCRDNTKCSTGQVCCGGQCKTPACTTANAGTACPSTGDSRCLLSKTCVNAADPCTAACDVKYQSTTYTCAPTTYVDFCRSAKGGQWWRGWTSTTYKCDASHACPPTSNVVEFPCDCGTCVMSGGSASCVASTLCDSLNLGDWCGYSITAGIPCHCYPIGGGTLICKPI